MPLKHKLIQNATEVLYRLNFLVVSVFHKEFVEKNELAVDVLRKAFSTAYLIMK